MRVWVKMKPVVQILRAHGLDKNGDVQRYWTSMVNQRITRCMPYRSGMLSGKLKYISGPGEITVAAPYARYQYYGRVMIDPAIGAAGFMTKDGTWRSRKGAAKVLTNRPLTYDNLMLAIMDEVDTTFAREQKATNPRIQKYTKKYHK